MDWMTDTVIGSMPAIMKGNYKGERLNGVLTGPYPVVSAQSPVNTTAPD